MIGLNFASTQEADKFYSAIDSISVEKPKGKSQNPKKKNSPMEIGAPTSFRHIKHIGFNPITGAFDVRQ